jgi:hypothetical protein
MHHAHVGIYQFVKFSLLHIRDFVIRDTTESGATVLHLEIITSILMQTVKRSSMKNKIKYENIQELWFSFDARPSWHLS